MTATRPGTEPQFSTRWQGWFTGIFPTLSRTSRAVFSLAFGLFSSPAQSAAPPALALPSAQQVVWHDCEMGVFIHLGPATWQDSEYDTLGTPLEKINPERLDTDQWVAAAEAMGAKYIIFVAKHTGRFCWWQTETTDYGVRNIP